VSPPVPLDNFDPGSPAWMTKMTASKVAAVLGLSPWESRYSLWHRMAGLLEPELQDDDMTRGHYLEPAVAHWFADQHPDLIVGDGGPWQHPARDWQAATPDRLCYAGPVRDDDAGPVALLEVKTSLYSDEWGEPGTDEIPPYYRAQVVWQMDTLGLSIAHVAVLLLQAGRFAEYRVDYNPTEAEYIRDEAREFLNSLPGGPAEQVPSLDEHAATYAAVRKLHPDINPVDVDVPAWLARDYCAAVKVLRDATRAHDYWRTVLADHMQTARRALFDGKPIASRRAKGAGDPYVQAAAKLPEEIPA